MITEMFSMRVILQLIPSSQSQFCEWSKPSEFCCDFEMVFPENEWHCRMLTQELILEMVERGTCWSQIPPSPKHLAMALSTQPSNFYNLYLSKISKYVCKFYPHTEIDSTVELSASPLTHSSIVKANVNINHTASTDRKDDTNKR